MKKTLAILPLLFLLAASCSLFNKTVLSGMVKSVNGGADWQFANVLKSPVAGNLSTLNISKIFIDPNNHQLIYAAAYNGGLYKSEDSAATWSRILSKILVYDFAIDPNDPKIIYAAGLYAGNGKVLKTTDSGASWQEIYNEGSSNNPVRSIVLNPAQSSQIVIGTEFGNVIKSSDSGGHWQLAKSFDSRINRIIWQNNSVYVLVKGKGLFKSAGFADNFIELSANISKAPVIAGVSIPVNTLPVFNQAYVDFLTPSLIYLTTDRGLYKTTDEGANWSYLQLPIKSGAVNTRPIAVARTSSNIVYTAVGATIYKSVDSGQTFQTQSIATDGFINYIAIDPALPQINYAGVYANQ